MINLIAVKIHQLYKLIDWLNKNHSTDINKLPSPPPFFFLKKKNGGGDDNLENSS
jgi:hypothetical protein